MWPSTPDKNENGSVLIQKVTKWSVHLEWKPQYKETKSFGRPHKIRVMYEIKRHKEVSS